jgi:hypothetical protein
LVGQGDNPVSKKEKKKKKGEFEAAITVSLCLLQETRLTTDLHCVQHALARLSFL